MVFFACCCTATPSEKALVVAYTYHSKPPYIVDIENKQGSYFDFIDLLNEQSDKYRFTLEYIPRNRLNRFLSNEQIEGFIIGVNPKWFNDVKRQKYYWSNAIFSDRDEFVSLAATPFDYVNQQSLHGKIIGASRGFVYRGIDTAVAQGVTQRVDAADEASVFKLVLKGRVDVGIISQASLPMFLSSDDKHHKIHLSAIPHDSFTRHLLIPKINKELFEHLQKIIPLITAIPECNKKY